MNFHDGCSAGFLSETLNELIGVCCYAHDLSLDHSYDLQTFVEGNWDFFLCAASVNPALAVLVFGAVSSPIGLWLYLFGPKREGTKR